MVGGKENINFNLAVDHQIKNNVSKEIYGLSVKKWVNQTTMAKKKSTKPKMMWVYSPTATKAQKEAISRQFEPLIEELKKNIKPLPEPQEFNQCVDVFSKWRGNYFYIMQKYKTGEGGIKDYFDIGLARLEFYGENRFNLAFFRHTGKWEPIFMYEDISFEEAKKAILEDPMFQVF